MKSAIKFIKVNRIQIYQICLQHYDIMEGDIRLISQGVKKHVYVLKNKDSMSIIKIYSHFNDAQQEILLCRDFHSHYPYISPHPLTETPIPIEGCWLVRYSCLFGLNGETIQNINPLSIDIIAHSLGQVIGMNSNIQGDKFTYSTKTIGCSNWSSLLHEIVNQAFETCLYEGIVLDTDLRDSLHHQIATHRSKLDLAEPTFIHADLLPKNLLFEKGELSGVIDFETSFYGALEWDLLQLDRVFFRRFPETFRIIMISAIQNAKHPRYIYERFAIFSQLSPLYRKIETVQFWSWAYSTSLREEVLRSIATVLGDNYEEF